VSGDLITFDVNVDEDASNYSKVKNYNCGIDVNHPIFKAAIYSDPYKFINQLRPEELRKSIPP